MDKINKQLETLISKLTDITAVSSSGAMDDWWAVLSDKSKIEDVLDLSGATGVLQNNVVGTANILDNTVELDKLQGGAVNWANVRSNPTGSDIGDTYIDDARVFNERGSSFYIIKNTSETVSKATPANGTFYNINDGGAADDPNNMWIIPIDMLYDTTARIPRFPTLRFELVLGAGITNPDPTFPDPNPYIGEIPIKLNVLYMDRSAVPYTVTSHILQLDSSDDYYSGTSSSILLKTGDTHALDSASTNDFWWVAGEINMNQATATGNLLDNDLVNWWGNYNNTEFPDTTIQNSVTYGADTGGAYLGLGGCIGIVPDIALSTPSATYPTVNSLNIYRQSVYLVNKYLDNDGWAVSERFKDY